MMGRQVERAQLFHEFSLEWHVPLDHLLRRLDRALDLWWLRAELAPFYGVIGRPSVDATIKGFEVMRALKKGQDSLFRYLPGVAGEVSLVHRAFGFT